MDGLEPVAVDGPCLSIRRFAVHRHGLGEFTTSPIVELLTGFDADYSFIDNEGSVFFFQTDLDAPLRRVIAIDVAKPERANIPRGMAERSAVGAGE